MGLMIKMRENYKKNARKQLADRQGRTWFGFALKMGLALFMLGMGVFLLIDGRTQNGVLCAGVGTLLCGDAIFRARHLLGF